MSLQTGWNRFEPKEQWFIVSVPQGHKTMEFTTVHNAK